MPPLTPIAMKSQRRPLAAGRDADGVPYIDAPSWLDALYGLGYVHASDRGTQILFARAIAAGRAAELIADDEELLETDRFFRRVGLHLDLEEEVSQLDDYTFEQLTAYCEGVNDGLADAGRSWPMWATGFERRPWNQQAVLLVGKLLAFGGLAISQMQNERVLVELIHAGVRDEALREMFAPRLDGIDFDLLRQVKMANSMSDEALELLADLPRLAGSNAWAVAPRRSASGHALLAGDPHLEINRLPAIWYEAVLRWQGRYVCGATLPGCPLFAVARTERLAWSVTYMKGDTVDYFIEDCRRNDDGGWQYRRADGWRDFICRQEPIGRKGKETELFPIYENGQGTLESDLEELGEGLHLSFAWSGRLGPQQGRLAAGRAIGTWLDLVAAESVWQAADIVKMCPQPTLNFVLADVHGNIGLQGCGLFPRRGDGITGLAPVPAWEEANRWKGWLSEDYLPRAINPESGYIATANEEWNPPEGVLLVSQILPDYRKRRIEERLRANAVTTLEEMQSIQYDVLSLQARELLEIFLPHLPEGALKTRLSAWDFRYTPDSREAALFQRLYVHVLMQVFGHEQLLGWRRAVYVSTRVGYSAMIIEAADRLLKREGSIWLHGRDKGELIRRAAERITEKDDKPWSEVNNFHFTDRFFGAHQVGRLLGFNSGRYPMPGCHATPFQGHVFQTATREATFAPSYHFVTDMGTDEAWTNMPGGPSEFRFSSFYRNDVPRWLTGEYKRLVGADETL